MTWTDRLHGNSLDWLLEPTAPAVRYLALRDLMDVPQDNLKEERRLANQSDPIAFILSKMDPAGFWDQPGPGYSHKYHSTVWSILSLAQTGASIEEDERIYTACSYLLDHALTRFGQFTPSGAPSYTFDCLQGNMCWALTELGCQDERLNLAYDWIARSITGEGIAPARDKDAPYRYYSMKCGPNFACGANGKNPCAWGAVKLMLALGARKYEKGDDLIKRAEQMGIDFLFSSDPTRANYPTAPDHPVSQNWWRFGFPVYYISDVLQVAEALISVGAGSYPRLQNFVDLILSKQDEQGRWALEYSYSGKAWGSFGAIHKPNKWVTLRALRVIKNTFSDSTDSLS